MILGPSKIAAKQTPHPGFKLRSVNSVSGILSAFYSTGLIEFMQERRAARAVEMRQLNPTFVSPSLCLYVDDGRITVHSDSLQLNYHLTSHHCCGVFMGW